MFKLLSSLSMSCNTTYRSSSACSLTIAKPSQVRMKESPKRFVVVFDIDNTLCKSTYIHNTLCKSTNETETVRKHHPECPIIEYSRKLHVFLPYLHILFEYLLKHRVRIVFFSSGTKERNITVIPKLLEVFWGTEKYEKLKSEGQFDIFSQEDVRTGRSIGGEGCIVKDLNVAIPDTDSNLDAILVEDDDSYIAYDQKPCLYILDLLHWCMQGGGQYHKNSVYYMLGVFKTYFENEEYQKLPLRVSMDQIFPRSKMRLISACHPFRLKMIYKGLEEVQKKVPHAVLYTMSIREKCEFLKEQTRDEKFPKETNFESFVRNLRIGNVPLYLYYLANYLFEKFADTNQSVDVYQGCIVNLIKSLKDRDDLSIEEGPKIYDACIKPNEKFDWERNALVTTLLSFSYVSNEKELENTAKKAFQDIQPQVDIKKSSDSKKIVSAGIAFSATSFLAAYSDHYKDHKEIYLTDMYVR